MSDSNRRTFDVASVPRVIASGHTIERQLHGYSTLLKAILHGD